VNEKPIGKKRTITSVALKISLLVAVIAGVALAMYADELRRFRAVVTLFEPDVIVDHFRGMGTMFDTRAVRHDPDHVYTFERDPRPLPETYEYGDETKSVSAFLEQTGTSGLAVIVNDKLVFEEYYLGNDETTKWISWSVAKSFVSALVGIAIDEGHIEDVHDPVTKYVPFLKNTGYDGVPIKHVLQMSSGVRFDETYADYDSDINRMGRSLAFNTALDDFVASLESERPSGEYHHYVSMDTQVLAMVLRETTGQTLAQNLEDHIWTKIGMESDAYWLIDGGGMEMAFGGLNAVLRDYARFGLLYLHGGAWNGQRIVPADWVAASVTPDAAHLQPGDNPDSDSVMGYGHQWWIPENPEGDFLAIGVYNQFIYVHPGLNVVIAKTSAYADYNENGEGSEVESVALFRGIAKQLTDHLGEPGELPSLRPLPKNQPAPGN
jgi:hypothetical protein